MRPNSIAVKQGARIALVAGLSLALLMIPSVQASHLLTSPATLDIPAPPKPDAAAIRGRAVMGSSGPADLPVGVSGWSAGDATGIDGRVAGVEGRAPGNAVGAGSRVFGVRGIASGNILDPSARVIGVEGRTFTLSGVAIGVRGVSDSTEGFGVRGFTTATSGANYGVFGTSDSSEGNGVVGIANATSGIANGVVGVTSTDSGTGVLGQGPNHGIVGQALATSGPTIGVVGEALATSGPTTGVLGTTYSNSDGTIGVAGLTLATSGVTRGVRGLVNSSSDGAIGVLGEAQATSGDTRGVLGFVNSPNGRGVVGEARANTPGNGIGVLGLSFTPGGVGIRGIGNNGANAGVFDGRVDINCASAPCLFVNGGSVADLAEDLPVAQRVTPGDVVVLARSRGYGVAPATRPYDTLVAGIISTTPRMRFGVKGGKNMAPVAMVGIVKANASTINGPIRFGDLLTTSRVPGHLMRCATPARCVGAIVGKALEPLGKGKRQILVLIWRQ